MKAHLTPQRSHGTGCGHHTKQQAMTLGGIGGLLCQPGQRVGMPHWVGGHQKHTRLHPVRQHRVTIVGKHPVVIGPKQE